MSVVSEIASRQSGVMARRQLLRAGLSARSVDRLVGRGELQRSPGGILQVPGWPASWRQDVWRTWLRAGDQAVVSHRTAAAIHRLDGFTTGPPDYDGFPGPIDVSVPHSRNLWGPGVHHVRNPAPDILLTKSWLPYTSLARTLSDAGAVVDANEVERGLECALRLGDITLAEAYEMATQLQGRGRRGPGALLEVLDRRPPGAPPTESDLETCLLQLSRRAGVREPVRQWELRANGRIYRLDFAWPHSRFAIEGDGADTHTGRQALVRDLRRQNQIVMGWLILRFTWEDIYLYPDVTCQVIREAWLYMLTSPTPSQLANWQAGGDDAIRSN